MSFERTDEETRPTNNAIGVSVVRNKIKWAAICRLPKNTHNFRIFA